MNVRLKLIRKCSAKANKIFCFSLGFNSSSVSKKTPKFRKLIPHIVRETEDPTMNKKME